MTVLSAVQDACVVIGLNVPTVLYSSTARELVELRGVVKEISKRIAFDTHDWNKLKTLGTLTGDGSAMQFDLPADYRRMIKKANLWPSAQPYYPLVHYPDADQWLGLEVQNFTLLQGAWTIIGEQFNLKPAVPAGATVKFYYISDLIVKPATGPNQADFTKDTDSFRLDERVLTLGIIWQWRANKGVPYAEDLQNYEDALSVSAGSDRGSNILRIGQPRMPVDAVYAYPGTITP